jgi:vitamin B12 transporter
MSSKSKLGFLMFLVLTGSTLSPLVAAAEESVPTYNLDEVVVTASRTEKSVLETPANTKVIKSEEIKTAGYDNAFEAVRNLTQANAHTYQDDGGNYGGMVSRIRMRALDNGTLVMVNGTPVNYMNSSSLANIPVDQIEKVEVVKGANSVLYGPQAMAGVVNVILKKPQKTGQVHGSVFGTAGNMKKQAGINVQTDYVDVGYSKRWNKDFNDIEKPGTTGSGPSLNVLQRSGDNLYVDAQVAKDLTFNFGRTFDHSKFEVGSFSKGLNKIGYAGVYDTDYNNYTLLYNPEKTGWKIAAGYTTMDIEANYDHSYKKYYTDSSYFGYNLNLDAQKKFNLRNDKDYLIVGTTLNREYMKNHYGPVLNINGRNNYSLYQSYDYKATDKLDFTVGVREYYMTKSKDQDSDFQLLPQFQGLYKVNDKASYYFNIGKSFEMPSISSGFAYSAATDYVINTDLKPQSGWSYETGYKYEDQHKALAADVFYMTVKDKFYWDKDALGRNIMRNRDEWKNIGLELNYTQKLTSNFSTTLGLTMQNPQAKTGSADWVQDSAKYILNLGADYKKDKFTVAANLFSYLGREDAYYNYTRTSSKSPDHSLRNSCDLMLSLGYNPTKSDSFKLIGRNLLNRDDVLNNYEYLVTPANFTLTYARKF